MWRVDASKPCKSLILGRSIRFFACLLLGILVVPACYQPASAVAQQANPQPSGTIRGTVLDQTGTTITGARVKLTRDGEATDREVLSDESGEFSFANVAPGPFKLTITSEGLATQELPGTLQPGENQIIPPVMMTIAKQVTEVRVSFTQVELAQEQIKDQEKQRVLGFIPNFYVSYVPDAAPLTPKQKFELAWKSSKDPITFLGVGGVAAAYQKADRWPSYGQGAQGYAKRYGAVYANVFAGTYLGSAVLPSLLKQDPRYYYRGRGTKKSRLLYALSGAFICKGDNGQWQTNYSNIAGTFGGGGLAYLYYPANERHGAGLLFSSALLRFGEVTVANVFQEFIVPRFTPNLPTRAPSGP